MGTELQYAVNLLATSSPNPTGLTPHSVDDWEVNRLLEKGLRSSMKRSSHEKLQVSMERLLQRHHMESIKKTMLMQEDTFRHQVQELHRLYRVQKMLMIELRRQSEEAKFLALQTGSTMNDFLISNQHHPVGQTMSGNDIQYAQSIREDPTLWSHSESFTHGTLPNCDEEPQVELTLSLGGSMARRSDAPGCSMEVGRPQLTNRKEIRQKGSSVSLNQDGGEECSEQVSSNTNSTSLEVERQQPHWLFQGLNLNRA